MKTPEIPKNEAQRLAALRDSGLLDAGDPHRFDRLTRLAKHLFNVPMALVTLVDETTLVFKSSEGVSWKTLPRNISFCGHAILSERPLIVPDATTDERFSDNPLVTGNPHIRFYAGYPLRLPDGAIVGSFCLIDHETRGFAPAEQEMLKDLASIVEDDFAIFSVATTDDLTGLLNRRGFEHLANYAIASSSRRAEPLTLGWIDLDKFKEINDNFGHDQGDAALRALAELMRKTFRESDLLVRHGGDEFAILFLDTNENGAFIAMQHMAEVTDAFNATSGKPWRLAFSWGVTEFDHAAHSDVQSWLRATDKRMYEMKLQRDINQWNNNI